MTIFISSDLHVGHFSILKYCPHRQVGEVDLNNITPYDVQRMNEKIITNWNSVVKQEDVVLILGDVMMGKLDISVTQFKRLNGQKMLISGNHDKTLIKRINNGDPEFQGLFTNIVPYYEFVYKSDSGKKTMICMMHYPISSWNGKTEDESSSVCFHGHLHSSPENRHRQGGKIMDVGMDGHNLFPYTLEEAIRLAEEHAKLNPGNYRH